MPDSKTSVEISVVIVAWNTRHYLELCLESLAKDPPRRSMEVLVVDNASADDTIEMIESRFPWVKLIKSKGNLGFSKGNNVAIRECQGWYIALVNPDVIVFPGCLDALADFLDENPKVGDVGPRVFNPDMTQQSTCRRFPTLWNNLCSATHLEGIFKGRRFFAGEHMFYFKHDQTLAVDVIVGCFSMIRREAFHVRRRRRLVSAGAECRMAGSFLPGGACDPRPRQNHGAVSRSLCGRATAFRVALLDQAPYVPGGAGDLEHHAFPSSAALRGRAPIKFCAIPE